jgi:hypothetical protein
VNFKTFLERIGADLSAKYVVFKCADDYYEILDMPTALHAQTIPRDEICARADYRPVRIPASPAHRHQAWLQEYEMDHRDRGH